MAGKDTDRQNCCVESRGRWIDAQAAVLLELAETPIVPGVTTHSIIAIKDDVNNKEGNDGVVEYRSAHLPGVASEFIVQSEHSCQQHPLTIEEVRRILVEHQATSGL